MEILTWISSFFPLFSSLCSSMGSFNNKSKECLRGMGLEGSSWRVVIRRPNFWLAGDAIPEKTENIQQLYQKWIHKR